jgi:hypothetical protein
LRQKQKIIVLKYVRNKYKTISCKKKALAKPLDFYIAWEKQRHGA